MAHWKDTGMLLFVGLTALGSLGCLAGLPLIGSTDKNVPCDITGTVVGEDGSAVDRLDIAWYPASELGSSTELVGGSSSGNTFTITSVKIAEDDQRVIGEVGVGQRPLPPRGSQWQQVRIEVDQPISGCGQDLGEIRLPRR